jgi:hypothetical protein
MYRAYACGVGLPQRPADLHWQNFLADNHKRRMKEMRPEIDNVPPPQFPHLKSNLKKRQMDEERCGCSAGGSCSALEHWHATNLHWHATNLHWQVHMDRTRQLPHPGAHHAGDPVAAEL